MKCRLFLGLISLFFLINITESCFSRRTPLIKHERCLQPLIKGICKGKLNNWYYNAVSGRCDLFIYGIYTEKQTPGHFKQK